MRGGVAEEFLQRLDGAVIHIHARRYRDVDAGSEDGFRAVRSDLLGNVERAGMGSIVTNSARAHTDTERRHRLVEEPVVMIRGKDDDEFGVVIVDELSRLPDRAIDIVKQVLRRPR